MAIQKSAAAYILENLTNRLVIEMSIKRNYLVRDYASAFSILSINESNSSLFLFLSMADMLSQTDKISRASIGDENYLTDIIYLLTFLIFFGKNAD